MPSLADIERAAVKAAVGPWAGDVARFRTALLAMWHARGGQLDAAEVRVLLGRLQAPGAASLAAEMQAAATLGDARVAGATAVAASTTAAAAAAGIAAKPNAALLTAQARLVVGRFDDLGTVLTVLAPLNRSVSEMTAGASFAVHRSANEAVASAAAQTGAKVVFVPERDACLECTGHAGDTGSAATVEPPPIHPNCRCELHTYDDPEVPKALKREAVRSVLRGFSLPSESEAERLRAASALLARRPVAPASVQAYARRAIREGHFPRGRRLP